LAEVSSENVMDFKICTQLHCQDKIDEKRVAYQLGLSLTESLCNLRTYLKLAQVDTDAKIKHLCRVNKELIQTQTELVLNPKENPFAESSITAVE
jgi:hypothetical protein